MEPNAAPEGPKDTVGTLTDILTRQDGEDTPAEEAPEAPDQEPSDEPAVQEPEGDDEPIAAEGEEAPEEPAAGDEEPVYRVVVDGQTSDVGLSELLAGYQRQGSYTKQTQEFAAERQKFEAEREAFGVERQQGGERLAALLGALDQQVAAADPVNWDELRQDDPAEYVRRKEQIREQAELRHHAAAEHQRLVQAELASRIPVERGRLAALFPEWGKPEQMDKGLAELGRWLVAGEHVSQEEWDQVYDHRLVALAEKARRWDDLQGRTPVAKQRVKNLPKVARPGAARDTERQLTTQAKRNRERLRQTGDVKDAARVMEGLL